jgi:hypothetical protein
MSEGFDSAPLLMASLPNAHALVEYRAKLVSDFNPEFSHFWGNKAFIAASGYTCSASLKTSHPCGLSI